MTVPSRELTPDDLELIEFAREIVDANSDGDVSAHTMAAAVRGADGKIYGGINVYHFTGGPCAELVALGHARASGARELSTIVAVGDAGRGPVGPCGRDRQVLFDYHPGIRVLLPTPDGVRSVRIEDLLPLAEHASRAQVLGRLRKNRQARTEPPSPTARACR
ncbi:cytidine deaminase family protein [Streptomyces fuscichromogenes]|uniref:Cytidine deaminase n=1 Tax=Streptomyces fuscichromogenes TaxID=1324013 RepID=A0A917UII6_9ACTN|nr:cytidine deaminase [Streptomyces fuscichromogenes]GGM88721.1 cytidine deaminase [Streptomyces fuscichromogenes]